MVQYYGFAEVLVTWLGQRRLVFIIVFRGFCNFCDSYEYGLALDGISDYLVVLNDIRYKSFPGATTHEEYDVKMSVSDVHLQYKIWMLPLPTN